MAHSAMVRGIPKSTYEMIKRLAERDGTSVNKAILRILVATLDKPEIMGTIRFDSQANPCLECSNTSYYARVTVDGRIIGPYCETCI